MRLISSSLRFVFIGGLPQMISNNTTPKLYTSLFSVNLSVLKYMLNTKILIKNNSFSVNNIVKNVCMIYPNNIVRKMQLIRMIYTLDQGILLFLSP